ncbi:MAG TPA: YceI family protein [Chthoniobacterales bacterium]
MKLLSLFSAALLAVASLSPVLAADTYEFDPAHSTIGFRIRHLFSDVSGRFNKFSGKIVYDEAAPEKSSVDVTIQADSIDTANAKRDTHLKTPDFFDVEKYPELTFKGKKVEKKDAKTFVVTGDLTIHGVTHEVPVTVEFLGKGKGVQGEPVSGWSASTTIDRNKFGVTYNSLVEGSKILGDDVKIDIQVEAHGAK